MKEKLYIGLMSGTSLDAVDAALLDFSNNSAELIATHSEPISKNLHDTIIALCQPGENAIHRMGQTDIQLGELFAAASNNLIKSSRINPKDIAAIGSHGQTIRHMPTEDIPFTLQIGDPNTIAARTNITTVADFRRRDMALGGQAAPLAPAFHHYLLHSPTENRAVINIGGIANLTILPMNNDSIIGFDTGPGNLLLNTWNYAHNKTAFDRNGKWARSGTVNSSLLNAMLADPYFAKPAPKSTGREYFNQLWLESQIEKLDTALAPEDIQATLIALTAVSIVNAIQALPTKPTSLWVCGGGANNIFLMEYLAQLTPSTTLQSTKAIGIHPDWIEAAAFAWLAKQTLNHQPGNLPSVTGASQACILGAIFQA